MRNLKYKQGDWVVITCTATHNISNEFFVGQVVESPEHIVKWFPECLKAEDNPYHSIKGWYLTTSGKDIAWANKEDLAKGTDYFSREDRMSLLEGYPELYQAIINKQVS